MPRARPKVFLSDQPVNPDDVLPSRLAIPETDGDPDEEQPYNPIPKRPGEGPGDPSRRPDDPNRPVTEPNPDEFEDDEPNPDDVDGEPEDDENTQAPSHTPGEPASPPSSAGETALASPRLGSEYMAPVSPPASPMPPTVTYRSRISVVEAWRYPGQLAQAPDFIDRGWTAWADSDFNGSPSGPALRVPVSQSLSGPTPPDGTKLCRVGDYVVRQMVTLVDGLEPEESLDVWQKEAFERLFIPKKRKSTNVTTTPATQAA
jgi:hypothetical protein